MLPPLSTFSNSTLEDSGVGDQDFEDIRSLLNRRLSMVALVGPPGVGKTHLLHRILHTQRKERGEGSVFLLPTLHNLHDVELPEKEPEVLAIDDPAALATDAFASLSPLVGLFPDATIIATSWRTLSIPGVQNHQLSGLTLEEGIALYRRLVEAQGFNLENTVEQLDLLPEVVELLDSLPGAITEAASRSSAIPLEELRDLLRRRPLWLYGRFGDDELISRPVPGYSPLGLEGLNDEQRLLLFCAAAFPAQFDIPALAQLVDHKGLSRTDVIDGLCVLIDRCLIYPIKTSRSSRVFQLYRSARVAIERLIPLELSEQIRSHYVRSMVLLGRQLRHQRNGPKGHTSIRNLAQLVPSLREALRYLTEKVPKAQAAELYLSLDTALLYLGESENEISPFGQEPQLQDPLLRAEWWLSRGKAANRKGEHGVADEFFSRLIELLSRKTEPAAISFYGTALLERADVRRAQGQLREAFADLERASSLPHPGIQRASLAFRVELLARLDQASKARSTLDQFYALRPTEDYYLEARIWQRIGAGCFYLYNYDEQARAHNLSYDFGRKIDDPELCGIATQSLGDAAVTEGNLIRARRLYEEVLPEINHRHHVRRKAILLHNLASVYHRLGELERAFPCYMEALTLQRRCGLDSQVSVALRGLGVLHFERGRTSEALHHLERARSTEARPYDLGVLSLLMGWLNLADSNVSEARLPFMEALNTFRAIPNSDHWVYVAHLSSLLVDKLEGIPVSPEEVTTFDDRNLGHSDATQLLSLLLRAGLFETSFDVDEIIGEEQYPSSFTRALMHLLRSDLFQNQDPRPPSFLEEHSSEVEGEEKPNLSVPATPSSPAARPPSSPRIKVTTLSIGPESRWFQLDHNSPVDLRRRGAPRLILQALVEAHFRLKNASLSVDELSIIGWPRESLEGKAAADRVYWAIRTLRKLGLEDLLLTTDGGYRILSDVRIRALPNSTFPGSEK